MAPRWYDGEFQVHSSGMITVRARRWMEDESKGYFPFGERRVVLQ